MPREFKGKIELDVRDSIPDWGPFLAQQAPEDSPNVLAGARRRHRFGRLVEFTKERVGDYGEAHGTCKLYIDDDAVAEQEIRTVTAFYALCGEGLCIGYDSGDAVSKEYKPKFEFSGGKIVKVVFDVADDNYVDIERVMAAAMARDYTHWAWGPGCIPASHTFQSLIEPADCWSLRAGCASDRSNRRLVAPPFKATFRVASLINPAGPAVVARRCALRLARRSPADNPPTPGTYV